MIKRALYGGKTAGKDFRDHLRDCMKHLGFETCLADPDVWMRPTVLVNGDEVYEYVLLYTDDCLVVLGSPTNDKRNILDGTLPDGWEVQPEQSIVYVYGMRRTIALSWKSSSSNGVIV